MSCFLFFQSIEKYDHLFMQLDTKGSIPQGIFQLKEKEFFEKTNF